MNEPSKRISRVELYEAVWSKTMKALAQEWNTTYPRLVQACAEMEVPRPGQGHWQLVSQGLMVEKPLLPKQTGNIPDGVVFLPRGVQLEQRKGATERPDVMTEEQDVLGEPKEVGVQVEAKVEATPVPLESREPDLAQAAEGAVLDMIRQARRIDFWRGSISECVYPAGLASWLELGRGVKIAEGKLQRAVKNVRKEYRTFVVKVEEAKDRYDHCNLAIEISLREGSEWKDAWEEAWTFAAKPNPHCLSDNALQLYLWAKSPKNTGKMMDRRKIGAQARLRRTYSYVEDHLREIRLKADSSVQWEKEEKTWHGRLRVWFEEQKWVYYHHGPLNPALGLDVREVTHRDLERFKGWLHQEIIRPGFPEGKETVGLFDIRDRKTLNAVFSELPRDCGSYGPLPNFFEALRVMDGMEIRHEFEDGAGPWLIVCQLQEGVTWKEIKKRLAAKAGEIPLENRYSLSSDSQALLKWILDLRTDEYLQGMTPPVEEHLETDVGIETEFDDDNVRAYLELLVEEINEKTEFNLRTINWRHYNEVNTRILVKQKRAELEDTVRAVQLLGLSKGRLLDGDKIRASITALIGEV